ncbi:outer membrane protein [Alphaproteobacteria bacterium]
MENRDFLAKLKSGILGLGIFAFGVTVALSAPVNAADFKIGIIDMGKILRDAPAAQDASKQLATQEVLYKDAVGKVQSSLISRLKDLKAQENALSQETREAKQEELKREFENFEKDSRTKHDIFNKASEEAFQVLGNKIAEIAKNKAKSSGYSVILEKNSVFYVDDSANLDITDGVLVDLNKTVSSIKVDFEGAEKSIKEAQKERDAKINEQAASTEKKGVASHKVDDKTINSQKKSNK